MSSIVNEDRDLYRASLTVLKMLKNRGYDITEDDLVISEEEYLLKVKKE